MVEECRSLEGVDRRRLDATRDTTPHLHGRPDQPVAGIKANTTDPDSRIMKSKKGDYAQLYNVQAAACREQVILAVGTHDNTNDKNALHAILDATRATLDAAGIHQRIGTVLADNGYASTHNFTSPHTDNILIAVRNEHEQLEQTPRNTPARKSWAAMETRMTQPDNKTLYKLRGPIIEPVFGQLTNHHGRDLHHRGTTPVETELHLWAVTHNIGKLHRHRSRTPT